MTANAIISKPDEQVRADAFTLYESDEVVRAISGGEVDAFVVSEGPEPRVVTLSSADVAYRLLADKMAQGAVTVLPDFTVIYANPKFCLLVDVPAELLLGSRLDALVVDRDVAMLSALVDRASESPPDIELCFKRGNGTFPALIRVDAAADGSNACCLLMTDLTERKHHEAVAAAEAFASSILDQALDAVVVCDIDGIVVRASRTAHALCKGNPLLLPFDRVFPLSGQSEPLDLGSVLTGGRVLRNVEYEIASEEGSAALVVSAGPVTDSAGAVLGCVITMTDVSPLKRVEKELKAADARKDEMLAMVVHELRNPLSTIRFAEQVLARGGDPRLDKARQIISRSVQSISRLVEDLTDSTLVRLGRFRVQLAEVDLRDVVAAAVEGRQSLVEESGHTLTVNLQDAPAYVHGDFDRLTQVFVNLLNNAVKFTPPGGNIDVHLERDSPDHVIVTIRDSGVGMAAEEIGRIFDIFEQGRPVRQNVGLGIGLTLAKRIVTLHHGSISAESDGEGAGSRFAVRLPTLRDSARY